MATTSALTHALAHTARMQAVLADRPDHPRAPEYDTTMRQYRGLWAGLSPAQRQETIDAVESIHDMTPACVAAAVTSLEG